MMYRKVLEENARGAQLRQATRRQVNAEGSDAKGLGPSDAEELSKDQVPMQ